MLLERRVGFGGPAQQIRLLSIEQRTDDEVAVALELLDIGIQNDLAGHYEIFLS